MPSTTLFYGLVRRREVYLPSLWGWLVLVFISAGIGMGILNGIHPYLSPKHLVGGQILVMEGWIPDYSQAEALVRFRSGGYRLLVTTGGPLPLGMPFSKFGTYAELAAFNLRQQGLGSDSVVAVPSAFEVRDRTYQEAVDLKGWMEKKGLEFQTMDLFTFSVHGRRSLYLYRTAFGKGKNIGVYCARDIGYEAKIWWTSSAGVRKVIDETIAYLYAILWFHPKH